MKTMGRFRARLPNGTKGPRIDEGSPLHTPRALSVVATDRIPGSATQEDNLVAITNSVAITALAAIAGSLVGALGSAIGTWITARHQDRRDLLRKQFARREALYSDFIGESARLLVDAMQHNASELKTMLPVYALLGRIRLSSSGPVLQEAEEVIRMILSTYPEPNLTADQIESHAVNGRDPLRQFSDTCRRELDSLQGQL